METINYMVVSSINRYTINYICWKHVCLEKREEKSDSKRDKVRCGRIYLKLEKVIYMWGIVFALWLNLRY